MGHGTVADEIKGRAPQGGDRSGAILAIAEEGVRFRSYIDGDERFMAPETSMEVQAALGSDLALVFDECTPFHVTRDYTARSTERTHRWLRPLPGLARRARPAGAARLRDRPGRRPRGPAPRVRAEVAASGSTGSRSAARSGETRRRCTRSSAGRRRCSTGRARRRATCSASARSTTYPRRRARHRQLRLRDADALGRHGMALVPDPERRWRVDLTGALARTPTSRSWTAARARLRRRASPRLPALPAQGARAHRHAARHAAQPRVRLRP